MLFPGMIRFRLFRSSAAKNDAPAAKPKRSIKSQKSGLLYHQNTLPRLPVPKLQQTLNKYLKVVKPLVSDSAYAETEELVKRFSDPEGPGQYLQKQLLKYASKKENWLTQWWLDSNYLESRRSVVIYCSPSVTFPKFDFIGTEGQITQAAKVIGGILHYKCCIDNETIAIDKMGNAPLCMDQYYRILSSCRIPGTRKDSIMSFAKSWRPPKHITVIHNNHFFELIVYHDNGCPLSVEELITQLKRIVDVSLTPTPAVGILTSRDREGWEKSYQILQQNEHSHNSIQSIHRSLFAICLDGNTPAVADSNWRSDFTGKCLHGGGSNLNSGNRWFDKTMQLIIDKNGGVGVVYEHSPAEGPPIANLLDSVYHYCENPIIQPKSIVPLPQPKHLYFGFSNIITQHINQASRDIDDLIAKFNLEIVHFKEYGKDFIKSQKLSPDSFFQMALQVAYYQLHRRAPATYESASLRQFHLGRTETIRSCSVTSDLFSKAMTTQSISYGEKARLLRDAVTAHKEYTNDAILGQGIDRHLFGLRLTAERCGMDTPDLFEDSTYKRAMNFNLSTSQVPCQTDLIMAYGPAIVDGYGVCYNPKGDSFLISLSSFKDNPAYDVEKFHKELFTALKNMKNILLTSDS